MLGALNKIGHLRIGLLYFREQSFNLALKVQKWFISVSGSSYLGKVKIFSVCQLQKIFSTDLIFEIQSLPIRVKKIYIFFLASFSINVSLKCPPPLFGGEMDQTFNRNHFSFFAKVF